MKSNYRPSTHVLKHFRTNALSLLLLSLAPLASRAETEGNYTYYVFADGTAYIAEFLAVSYSSPVIIPSSLGGHTIVSIGNSAFQSRERIPSVVIPSSIRKIGDRAFSQCYALKTVSIPSSVTNMGVNTFLYTGLTDVEIPGSLASIPPCAFTMCTNLTTVTICNGVAGIGDSAFEGCTKLSKIIAAGMNINHGPVIPGCVKSIGTFAFRNCVRITSLTIDEGVTSIGASAFGDCAGLTSVSLPSSLAYLGAGAFSTCLNLRYVFFRGNVPISIGGGVFASSTNSTIYYMFGSTGWGSTFPNDARPNVLWHPQIQSDDSDFGVHENAFSFIVKSTTAIPVVVEVTTNLASDAWVPLQTNTITSSGPLVFSDSTYTSNPARFYRIAWP